MICRPYDRLFRNGSSELAIVTLQVESSPISRMASQGLGDGIEFPPGAVANMFVLLSVSGDVDQWYSITTCFGSPDCLLYGILLPVSW